MSENLLNSEERDINEFLFSGIDATDDKSLDVFEKKAKGFDGIYRPKLADCKDLSKGGYFATLRFLPNIIKKEDGRIVAGPFAIEKHVHYVNLKNEGKLGGNYDCNRNFGPECDICKMYWKLANSKNEADIARAEIFKKSTKYYSYVQILEDLQNPQLVGKIMIYPYSWTIKELILAEKKGEKTGKTCNPFDIISGKDFRLIIKKKGEFESPEQSTFLEVSPAKIYDEVSGKFKALPIDANGKISNAGAQKKFMDMILNREIFIENHKAVQWTPEVQDKVDSLMELVAGGNIVKATNKANGASRDGSKASNSTPLTADEGTITQDDFFDVDEN